MRAGLPIAVRGALLALVAGAALWLSREDGTAVAPVAREVTGVPPRPEPDVREPDARAAAPAPQTAGEPTLPAPRVPKELATGTAALAGRLRLDGGPPGEVVALTLEERDGPPELAPWDRVRELASHPDGSFHVGDLPDGWTGVLRLPAHYLRTDVAPNGPDARRQGVRAGDLGVVVDVERLPTLRGRVLGPLDRAPVAGLEVDLRTHWGHLLTMSEGRTDAAGRFQLALRDGTLQELTLECEDEDGASFVRTWEAADLPPPGAYGDIDLGDLTLRGARTAWLTVLDPAGAPVEGARVLDQGTLDRRSYTTDADGRVALQLLSAPEGFEVQARGYAILEIPAPAPGEEVEVRLTGTNRLVIAIVDAAGEPAPGPLVQLAADAQPFEGGREWLDAFLMGDGDGVAGGGRSRARFFTDFHTGADGSLELQGLTVGLPLELSARDTLGGLGASLTCPGLAVGEVREVRLVLKRALQSISGRCRDRDGTAIAGARISLNEGHEFLTLTTDSDGRFAGPALFAHELRLRASAPGFADLVLDALAQVNDLELVLERGRVLVVELVDARGTEVDVGTLKARSQGYPGSWDASRTRIGQVTFTGLPQAPLELVHQWHGRSYVAQVDAHAETFRFELPPTGALEVRAGLPEIAPDESVSLVIVSIGDDRGTVEQRVLPGDASFERTFAPWPGRYRLRRVVQAWTDVGNGFREPAGERLLGEDVEVEVRAGETTRVTLP